MARPEKLLGLTFLTSKIKQVHTIFTNLPRNGAVRAVERVTSSMTDTELPLPKNPFGFRYFEFPREEYQQINGLAMGSPLSAVMTCLFMETPVRDNYKDKIGRHSTLLRYVNDVLVIVLIRSCLHYTLTRFESISPWRKKKIRNYLSWTL